jgi:hypothetical protein
MRTLKVSQSVMVALVLTSAALLAQQPARDVTGWPVGTAVLELRVVSDEPEARSIRRATIELNGVAQRYATTDADGRAVLTGLPAGRYPVVRVSHPAFVTSGYGQKRIGGPGAPIILADGQRLSVVVRMPRAAVISGLVTNQGRPAAQTAVTASAVRIVEGRRVITQAAISRAHVDERGTYRIAGLPPGDYVVTAALQTREAGEIRPVTDDEIKWALQQLRPGAAPSAPAPPASQPVAHLAVHYPDAIEVDRAIVVSVSAGQERTGVDLTLRTVPTARIDGRIFGLEGQKDVQLEVVIVPQADMSAVSANPFLLEFLNPTQPAVSNGTYSATGIRPGRYTIVAGATPPNQPGARAWWALRNIEVDGVDQAGVDLRLEPGMTLSGTVAFEDASGTAPATAPRATIGLSAAPGGLGVAGSIIPPATVNADGSFTIQGVPPGRYFLRPSAPVARPPGWYIKSARAGDVEAAEHPFEVRPSTDRSDLRIVFTNRTAEIAGTLFDANGQPAEDFFILLIPTDRIFWVQRSRFYARSTRTGSDGRFRFVNLLAGDWQLAAVSDVDNQDLANPEFLSELARSAIKVRVGEGETRVQDLRIQKTPQAFSESWLGPLSHGPSHRRR